MNFPHLIDALFASRGIPEGERQDFLNPDYGKLHDPLLLPDMEKARDRVADALGRNEKIMVFSDYDADGIPGAVVLSDFFKRAHYANVSFYIPHRHDEGFGLNTQAIDEAVQEGATLIITIDCGTADTEEIEYANAKGIDVIVTDHHECNELPPAYAVVNPKRKDSLYPFKELCGAAVAYKLVQAVLLKERFGIKEGMEKWSLDMVGIATLSDMVPLIGENRILAKFGLEVLRKSTRPGLLALFDALRMTQRFLTEDDITFMITPRINAASRMGKPEDAFNLLATTDPREAKEYAAHLEKINKERKTTVGVLVKEAKARLKDRELREVIVIGDPEWRPSLCGLVANSLVEEYLRPVFVWGRDGDGVIKGSCRSYNGYDLHELMNAVADAFIEYGGHAGAGGFAVSLEHVGTLEERLSQALGDMETELAAQAAEGAYLGAELSEVAEDLWTALSAFAPFGMANEKPVFKFAQAEIATVRTFGKTGEHLEVLLVSPRGQIKAVSFFSAPENYNVPLVPGARVTLLAHLEKSYFMNRPELRLRIVDIQ